MNKEELEQAFNETTDNAVDLLKENVELKNKYNIMKENAYILAERIDKAIEYIEKTNFWGIYEDTPMSEVLYGSELLEILRGDKE